MKLNKACEDQVSRNIEVILWSVFAFVVKRSSFRGHRDDYTASESDNKGNFVELVQFRAETDDVLRKYLEAASVHL